MTEHLTWSLFASDAPETQVVRGAVSRLVADVERFEVEEHEPMAARGMGAIHSVSSSLNPMRRPLHAVDREALL